MRPSSGQHETPEAPQKPERRYMLNARYNRPLKSVSGRGRHVLFHLRYSSRFGAQSQAIPGLSSAHHSFSYVKHFAPICVQKLGDSRAMSTLRDDPRGCPHSAALATPAPARRRCLSQVFSPLFSDGAGIPPAHVESAPRTGNRAVVRGGVRGAARGSPPTCQREGKRCSRPGRLSGWV